VLWLVLVLLILIVPPVISWLILMRNRRRIPPPCSFVEVDGTKLHYCEKGTGSPVVFIHGSNGSLQDFRLSVMDEVAKDFRAIAFDRPGHGFSERQPGAQTSCAAHGRFISEAWRQLGVERPILVGHSSAGAVLMDIAVNHPHEVSAIVLINGVVHSEGLDKVPINGLYRWLRKRVVGSILIWYAVVPLMSLMSGTLLRFMFAPDPVSDVYAKVGISLALRPGSMRHEGEDLQCLAPTLKAIESRYAEVKVPLVILSGEKDGVVPAETNSLRLAQEVPSATLLRLPGAGHLAMFGREMELHAAIAKASEMARQGP
jgi:pimeloyl-ACP methyl ester carboxylesterase